MSNRANRFGPMATPYQQPYGTYQNYQPGMTQPNPMQQPQMMGGCGCKSKTTYQECPPIVTCSKNVVEEYHIVKQPYIHNYHTEVVHHHVKQAEYIPTYSCNEVHVNDTPNM